jgi:hypothetical protein
VDDGGSVVILLPRDPGVSFLEGKKKNTGYRLESSLARIGIRAQEENKLNKVLRKQFV